MYQLTSLSAFPAQCVDVQIVFIYFIFFLLGVTQLLHGRQLRLHMTINEHDFMRFPLEIRTHTAKGTIYLY